LFNNVVRNFQKELKGIKKQTTRGSLKELMYRLFLQGRNRKPIQKNIIYFYLKLQKI